jgi:hypothetical protein
MVCHRTVCLAGDVVELLFQYKDIVESSNLVLGQGFAHTQLVALVWLLQTTVQCILVAHKNHEKHYTGKSQQLALYLVWKYAAQISVLVIHVNPRRGLNFFTCIPIKDQTSWLKLSRADLIAGTTLEPLRKKNWTRHQLFL